MISGKHSKMLFFFYIDWFHSLYRAPVLRILFSLCCPPFISTQNTHTHTHTHTHISFLHATVMSHITKAKLPWFSPCRTFIKIHASHLRPLESFSSKTAALVCRMPITSFYMRDIPVRAGIPRAYFPALEVTWPWYVCTGD